MLIPVILSGGKGSRLWPISRDAHPKPFIKLTDGLSLLQKTFLRAIDLPAVSEVMTVTNREYYFKTKDEYSELNKSAINTSYLLEPASRNTAPAIVMAALNVQKKYGSEAVMLVMPSDHLIENLEAFTAAASHAYKLAQNNHLVIFGITPTHAETGYGYIECGSATDKTNSSFHVSSFKEKPSLNIAQQYLASGRYLWNSGLFCFKASAVLEQMQVLAPDYYKLAVSCWEKTQQDPSANSAMLEINSMFSQLEDISIDYALMEKAKDVVVVAGSFDWNDIGSWDAMSKLAIPNEQGNCVVGEAVLLDVKNSYIQSEERLVAAIGIDDLLVVDTKDALLVAKRDRAQDVKKIVAELQIMDHETHKLHKTVSRPWGTYTVLEEGKNFKIKRIVVKPGAMLSLQMHHHRSEHWVVVNGTAQVVNGDNTFLLKTNESTYIPAGHAHRLSNPGLTDLVIIEVQSGEYVGEDDIVRLEDRYGRVKSDSQHSSEQL